MADPWKGKKLPSGVAWVPGALDALPSDWASVQYVLTIGPHPDDAARPICLWIPATDIVPDPGGGGFAPDDIASLMVWCEADSLVYSDQGATTPQTTDGGTVRRWESLLPDALGWERRSTAPNEGNAPTLDKTNTLNGLQTIRFAAASTQIMLARRNFGSDSEGELIMVLKMAADPAATSNSSGLAYFGAAGFSTHYPFTDNNVYDGFGTNTRKSTGNPSVNLAAWHVYDAWSASGDWALQLNGATHYSTATNTTSFITTPLLGRSLGASEHMDGWIAGLFYFNAKLSTDERADMLAYINAKWGV
jgi:hypothetical protein